MKEMKIEGNIFCPKCFAICDGVSEIHGDDDRMPKTGDVTLCIFCEEMLVFGENMELLLPPDGYRMPNDMLEVRDSLRAYKKEYPEKIPKPERRIFNRN